MKKSKLDIVLSGSLPKTDGHSCSLPQLAHTE